MADVVEDAHVRGSRVAVEGVIATGEAEHRVFGFAVPQVPAVGERVEHPDGVVWTVTAVRWRVRAGDEPDVSAVLVVEPE